MGQEIVRAEPQEGPVLGAHAPVAGEVLRPDLPVDRQGRQEDPRDRDDDCGLDRPRPPGAGGGVRRPRPEALEGAPGSERESRGQEQPGGHGVAGHDLGRHRQQGQHRQERRRPQEQGVAPARRGRVQGGREEASQGQDAGHRGLAQELAAEAQGQGRRQARPPARGHRPAVTAARRAQHPDAVGGVEGDRRGVGEGQAQAAPEASLGQEREHQGQGHRHLLGQGCRQVEAGRGRRQAPPRGAPPRPECQDVGAERRDAEDRRLQVVADVEQGGQGHDGRPGQQQEGSGRRPGRGQPEAQDGVEGQGGEDQGGELVGVEGCGVGAEEGQVHVVGDEQQRGQHPKRQAPPHRRVEAVLARVVGEDPPQVEEVVVGEPEAEDPAVEEPGRRHQEEPGDEVRDRVRSETVVGGSGSHGRLREQSRSSRGGPGILRHGLLRSASGRPPPEVGGRPASGRPPAHPPRRGGDAAPRLPCCLQGDRTTRTQTRSWPSAHPVSLPSSCEAGPGGCEGAEARFGRERLPGLGRAAGHGEPWEGKRAVASRRGPLCSGRSRRHSNRRHRSIAGPACMLERGDEAT